jgi:enoyl-CoA hydratase/carnithine racemase
VSHRPAESVSDDSPDWEVLGALARLGRDLSGAVRVVVVRCEGASVAGAGQLLALAGYQAAAVDQRLAAAQDAISWLRRPDLISVAAVPGPISGVLLAVALSCDVRVIAEGARFAITEIVDGLVGCLGATRQLVRLVGYPRALEWCLTGRSVSSGEAFHAGLANRVVPRTELDDTVTTLVATIVAAERDAVIETKALLAGAEGRTASGQDEAERAAVARLLGISR